MVPTHTELQKSYLQMKPREYRIEKFADKTFRVLLGTGSAGFLFLLREAPAANRDKSLAHELDTLKKLPATLAGDSKKKVPGKTRITDENRDFFLNCVAYLSGSEAHGSGEEGSDTLVTGLDRAGRLRLTLWSVLVLPGAVSLLTLVVVIRRRRRS